MRLWNSSRVVSNAGSWRPQGEVYNCSEGNARNGGVEWTINVTGLSDLPGSIYKIRDSFAIGTDFQRGSKAPQPANIWLLEYDLFAGTAEIAWHTTWTLPSGVQTITVEDVNVDQDLIIHSSKETRQTWGRRLSTGALVWGPTPMRHYTDNWGHSSGNSWDIIGEDKVIAGNYGGTVWCYDAQTGEVEWTFDIDDPYTEVLHNNRWRFRPTCVTDGKLYIENTEHNPRDPQPRGAPFICLDLETGEEIWRLPYRQGEWSTYAVVADSSIVMQNTYDQSFYVVAKGPSQTTVSANPAVSTHGSNVMVTGSVMDVSPGTQEAKIKLRFPNGVPAVSDESMTDMMTYVYNQYPKPMTTGVTVKVEAWDPNGNYQDLGSVMTDSYGNFGFALEPEVPGQYYIWATCEGTNGLYGSADSTYIVVDEAPSPATPIEPEEPTTPEEPETPTEPEEPETPTEPEEPEEPETPTEPEEPTEPEQPAEAPLITTEVAIILAVAIASIIGIGAFWYLRKR
jgi:outer membrane protein assembly factor BamB